MLQIVVLRETWAVSCSPGVPRAGKWTGRVWNQLHVVGTRRFVSRSGPCLGSSCLECVHTCMHFFWFLSLAVDWHFVLFCFAFLSTVKCVRDVTRFDLVCILCVCLLSVALVCVRRHLREHVLSQDLSPESGLLVPFHPRGLSLTVFFQHPHLPRTHTIPNTRTHVL